MAERTTVPPATGTALDPSTMPPVPLDQVLVLVNRFIKSTGLFLNDFSMECDSRMLSISKRMNKLSMEVALLESKFQSHEAEHERENRGQRTSPSLPQNERQDVQEKVSSNLTQAGVSDAVQALHVSDGRSPNVTVDTMNQLEQSSGKQAKDPRLSKYLGMLRVGIPRDAVIIKLQVDGLGDLSNEL